MSSVPTVRVRKSEAETGAPVLVPDRQQKNEPPRRRGVSIAFALAGAVIGAALFTSLDSATIRSPTSSTDLTIATTQVAQKRFESFLRTGGTVGATDSAMIRAPRMRGGRDRGGGGSLTIESLVSAGTIVQRGDIVAVFESKRTTDIMDDYESRLSQTRRRSQSTKAKLLVGGATLKQRHRKAVADADKADLDLGTAEVRSKIQAEILALQAQQYRASASQLADEVRLTELSDAAYRRSLDIDVEREELRLERTQGDVEKMSLKTPVSGLVVAETIFQPGGTAAQVAPGDRVNPGSYFLRVVDLSNMAVFATVNQADAQLVGIGAPAQVRMDAYPDAVFEARVTAIGAVASASTSGGGGGRGSRGGSRGTAGQWVRQVPLEVEILDADERIKPDLSASVDILLDAEDDAVVVPRAAIAWNETGSVVWVEQGDHFVERPVEVDGLSDTEAVIRAGVDAGEVIASQPVTNLDRLVAASR